MLPALASPRSDSSGTFRRVGRAVETGWPGLDGALRADAEGCGLVRGGVHEWIGTAEARGDAGPPKGAPWSPTVLLLTHLAGCAVADAAARGVGRSVVWVGRAVWPYPRVLAGGCGVLEVLRPADRRGPDGGHGLELELTLHERAERFSAGDGELFAGSLFVDVEGRDEARPARRKHRGRAKGRGAADLGRKLWAIDTALRCPSVTAVVADGSGLDMAASRRLQLVAARSNALVLLMRPPAERGEISAATTRWWVERTGAACGEDGAEPARGVRWRLELLRAKGAQTLTGAEPADADAHPRHRSRPALEEVHRLVQATARGADLASQPPGTEREDEVQRGGNEPARAITDERSPCGASSPSTFPTSPSTSPSGGAPAPADAPARSRPPASC